MIIANDELLRTVMFLITDEMCEKVMEICEFVNSKKFKSINAILDTKGVDSYTFKVMEDVPVVTSPEEDDEEQELITTTIYMEICPGGNTAFFCLYTDEDATCRVEGGDHDVFILDEAFASPSDIKLELQILMEEQDAHEAHTYKTAYHKIKNYLEGPLNKNQEEFPF